MITKHGIVSQVVDSYIEFQLAVLRALPRDINPDVALGWTQNGESLAWALREALLLDGKLAEALAQAGNTYPLSVNYGRSVEDGVKAGCYDWVNPNSTSRNFPTERKDTSEVEMKLIHFHRNISTDQALHELDRMGYRSAELHELLAFGQNYSEVQRDFPVIALGSVWQDQGGCRCVPCLFRNDSERRLDLLWVEGDWDEVCRFAAVRK